MRTEIIDGHVVDVIHRELSDFEQIDIAATLLEQGVHVVPVLDVYRVLHLWAQTPVTTEQEVRALAAFAERTDCRIAWHEAGTR
ncbi:hypothetical protein [Actinoplanes sp. NPDC049118]|uniref:hypothetical protein n=1 Tax=Actinoplanes sp. NPDC049118 TaxID=3155769 RepID=UPI0033D4F0D8